MKLAHHVIFIFCILTYFPGFVYSHGGKLSNEILLDYVKNSGRASETCGDFKISKGAIRTRCRKRGCNAHAFIPLDLFCKKTKKTSISLHAVAKAIKNKQKISNSNGSLKIEK